MSSEVVPATTAKTVVGFGQGGVQLTSMEDLYRFGRAVVESGLAPAAFKKPEQVMIAVQAGAEIGLAPMQALQSFSVIGGRPGLMVEPAMALVRQSGLLALMDEETAGEGDQRFVRVTLERKGGGSVSRSFSMAEAKRAGLTGKDVWKSYPDRMLRARALGFAIRDLFPDVLRGIGIAEEQADIPQREVRNVTPRPAPTGPDPLLAQLTVGEVVESSAGRSEEPAPTSSSDDGGRMETETAAPISTPAEAPEISSNYAKAIEQRIKMLSLVKSAERYARERMTSMVVDMLDDPQAPTAADILTEIARWKMS